MEKGSKAPRLTRKPVYAFLLLAAPHRGFRLSGKDIAMKALANYNPYGWKARSGLLVPNRSETLIPHMRDHLLSQGMLRISERVEDRKMIFAR